MHIADGLQDVEGIAEPGGRAIQEILARHPEVEELQIKAYLTFADYNTDYEATTVPHAARNLVGLDNRNEIGWGEMEDRLSISAGVSRGVVMETEAFEAVQKQLLDALYQKVNLDPTRLKRGGDLFFDMHSAVALSSEVTLNTGETRYIPMLDLIDHLTTKPSIRQVAGDIPKVLPRVPFFLLRTEHGSHIYWNTLLSREDWLIWLERLQQHSNKLYDCVDFNWLEYRRRIGEGYLRVSPKYFSSVTLGRPVLVYRS